MAASHLNFVPLPYLLVSWYAISVVKSLFMERFSFVLAFAISTIAPYISESLQGKTHITVAILQKILSTFSS